MNFKMTQPCAHCPFRHDIRPYLTKAKVREIERSLVQACFPCHETTKHDDEGEYVRAENETHCAGALILLEKLARPSQMMRIAERLRLYDRRRLNMKAPVFQTFKAMIRAQKEGR
jgi:hypothetical protein